MWRSVTVRAKPAQIVKAGGSIDSREHSARDGALGWDEGGGWGSLC